MNTAKNTALAEHEPFLLPDTAADGEFSREELAEDMGGLQLSFQRVKIPSGGSTQFELPSENPDDPDYSKFLVGVIVYSHNSNAYWPDGNAYDDSNPPACQSPDGKIGFGAPGGLCADCPMNKFGSDTKGTGRGKACKNMRMVYLLRSGELMPIQLSLSPTSITPYTQFVNAAFLNRNRGVCGGVVRIGLKKKSNGRDEYSVATFEKLYDFSGEDLARIRAYADGFRKQVKLILEQRMSDAAENAAGVEAVQPVKALSENEDCFEISTIDGDISGIPA